MSQLANCQQGCGPDPLTLDKCKGTKPWNALWCYGAKTSHLQCLENCKQGASAADAIDASNEATNARNRKWMWIALVIVIVAMIGGLVWAKRRRK
jgi:hypothetical protein